MVATNSLQEGRSSPDVFYLSVTMVVNPRQGVQVIIMAGLPNMYLIRFKLIGKITKSRKFKVDLVLPVDGYPFLKQREQGHLVNALNDAAKDQISIPVTAIQAPMIQTDGLEELPRRKLQLAPGA